MNVAKIDFSSSNAPSIPLVSASNDFETFLKMLTTQIQNQDPLSPMAADQFATQLASFSMVEQQSLTNQKIDVLVAALESNEIYRYSAIVGRTAFHEKPFLFSGSNIALEIGEFNGNPEELRLFILNSDGVVMVERELLNDQSVLTWDGIDELGRVVPYGYYYGEIRSISNDIKQDVPIYTGHPVEEIRFGGTQVELLLTDGTLISESEISKFR